MDANTRRAIEWDIERLGAAYAKLIDWREFDDFTGLFTPDGVLNLAGFAFNGRAEIRKYLDSRPLNRTSVHVITNFWVKVLNEREAEGVTYITVYRYQSDEDSPPRPVPMEIPFMVGHYQDRYRCADEGWRFASRELTPTFIRADGMDTPLR